MSHACTLARGHAPSRTVPRPWFARSRLLTALMRRHRIRRAALTLESLPDSVLADIGVPRAEIEARVREYYRGDPSEWR